MQGEDLNPMEDEEFYNAAQQIAGEVIHNEKRIKIDIGAIIIPLVTVMYFNPITVDLQIYVGLMSCWFIGRRAYIIYKLRGLMDEMGIAFK